MTSKSESSTEQPIERKSTRILNLSPEVAWLSVEPVLERRAVTRGHQWSSAAIRGHQKSSVVISVHYDEPGDKLLGVVVDILADEPCLSSIVKGNDHRVRDVRGLDAVDVQLEQLEGRQSMAINGNQWQSMAIDGNQWQSMTINGNQ